MSFVDISTTTPNTTSVKRGDYNLATAKLITVNKDSGSGTKIRRGYALSRDNTTTPNEFAVTTGKADGLVVISGLPFTWKPDNVNVTDVANGTGEDISAEDDDVAVNVITEGRVAVKFGGSCQPGQEVMTADEGEFVAYDGTGVQYIKGFLIGKPGAGFDAAVIKAGVSDGDIGIIEFKGGL